MHRCLTQLIKFRIVAFASAFSVFTFIHREVVSSAWNGNCGLPIATANSQASRNHMGRSVRSTFVVDDNIKLEGRIYVRSFISHRHGESTS